MYRYNIECVKDCNLELSSESQIIIQKNRGADIKSMNNSKANNSKANNSKANNSKANNSKANNTKANNSKANNSKANNSKANNSKANNSKVNTDKISCKDNVPPCPDSCVEYTLKGIKKCRSAPKKSKSEPEKSRPEKERPEKAQPEKARSEEKHKRVCTKIDGFDFRRNSCYIDSVLFALFSHPSAFIEKYVLGVKESELMEKLDNMKMYEKYTNNQKKQIVSYIIKIRDILVRYYTKLQNGDDKMKTSEELRIELSASIDSFMKDPEKDRWNTGREEDASELLRCIFDTFLIENIEYEYRQIFTKDGVESDKINETTHTVPPILQYNVSDIEKIGKDILSGNGIKTTMDLDDEYFENTPNNYKDQVKAAILNRIKTICLCYHLALIIKKKGEDSSKDELKKLLNSDMYTNIKNIFKKLGELVKNKELFKKELDKEVNEEAFYGSLMTIIYEDESLSEIIANYIKDYKQNKKGPFYHFHMEFLKQLKVYYNGRIEYNKYSFEETDENKYIVVSLGRFSEGDEKNKKQINISDSISTERGTNMPLNFVIVHKGRDISSGHYVCLFRCNDKWFMYSNTGRPKIHEIGTFKEMIAYNKNEYEKNAVLLFYATI